MHTEEAGTNTEGKMIVDTKQFAGAVAHAMVAVAARPPLPILAGIKLEATGGLLTVSGFDYDTQATATVPCDGDLPLTLVNGTLLKQVTGQAKGNTITAELVETRLNIEAGRAKVTLPTMPANEYPQPMVTPEHGFTIDGTGWDILARSVAHAASKEDTLPVLSAVNFTVADGQITAEATDRYRLAQNTVAVEGDYEGSFMMNAGTVLDVQRHLNTGATWQVAVNDSLAAITDNSAQIIRSLIDGDYPKISKLFPEDTEQKAIVNRAELAEAISRATTLLAPNETVKLTFKDDTVTLEAGTADHGAMNEQLDCRGYTGLGEAVQYNPLYLSEALKAVSTDEAQIGWNDAVRPTAINGITDTGLDHEHKQLVMPIRF